MNLFLPSQVVLLAVFSLVFSGEVFARSDILYPGAKIEKFKEAEVEDAHVVLSAPKRVSNTIRLEREKWIAGSYQSWLLRLDVNVEISEVADFYRKLLSAEGGLEFTCESRACGTSTNWANRIFSQAVLAGRDDNQHYVAGRYAHNNTPGWLSAYVVTNGRSQNYVFVQYVSENSRGTFGPSDQIFMEANALVDKQGARIRRLFDEARKDNGYILIMSHYRHTADLTLAQWESASNLQQRQLRLFLDDAVPGWVDHATMMNSAPSIAVPRQVESDGWYSFIRVKLK